MVVALPALSAVGVGAGCGALGSDTTVTVTSPSAQAERVVRQAIATTGLEGTRSARLVVGDRPGRGELTLVVRAHFDPMSVRCNLWRAGATLRAVRAGLAGTNAAPWHVLITATDSSGTKVAEDGYEFPQDPDPPASTPSQRAMRSLIASSAAAAGVSVVSVTFVSDGFSSAPIISVTTDDPHRFLRRYTSEIAGRLLPMGVTAGGFCMEVHDRRGRPVFATAQPWDADRIDPSMAGMALVASDYAADYRQ